jgi:hypothetical protein
MSFDILDYASSDVLYNGISRHIQYPCSAQPEQRLDWLHFMLKQWLLFYLYLCLIFELQFFSNIMINLSRISNNRGIKIRINSTVHTAMYLVRFCFPLETYHIRYSLLRAITEFEQYLGNSRRPNNQQGIKITYSEVQLFLSANLPLHDLLRFS